MTQLEPTSNLGSDHSPEQSRVSLDETLRLSTADSEAMSSPARERGIRTPPGRPLVLRPDIERQSPAPSQTAPLNIVFFGETGVGKSTIINMLRESSERRLEAGVATVSSDASGCTLVNTGYPCTFHDSTYILWDTAGLVEGEHGSVTAQQAEQNLITLLRNMEGGGVSLLAYCIRGRRYRPIVEEHYRLFYEKTCQGRIPMLLIVTGLENEPNMDDWWMRNQGEFAEYGVQIHACVCITSTRGKAIAGGHVFNAEYEESAVKLQGQVIKNCLPVNLQVPASKAEVVVRNSGSIAMPVFKVLETLFSEIWSELKSWFNPSERTAMLEANIAREREMRDERNIVCMVALSNSMDMRSGLPSIESYNSNREPKSRFLQPVDP